MPNLRILSPDSIRDATLTASPALTANQPVENLAEPEREKLARSTSTADQELRASWSGAVAVGAVALVRHNLTSEGTWRIQGYSDTAWTTQVYDSGTLEAYDILTLGELYFGIDPLGKSIFSGWGDAFSVHWLTEIVAVRSLKITLSDADNGDGYLQAARWFAGVYFEAEVNAELGLSLAWREDTRLERSEGGTLRAEGTEQWRHLRLTLAALDEGDRADLLELLRAAGMQRDLFVSLAPEAGGREERDYTLHAMLAAPVPFEAHQQSVSRATLDFEEV